MASVYGINPGVGVRHHLPGLAEIGVSGQYVPHLGPLARWKKTIKNLYRELREALGQDDESHGQLYIREGGETKAEWEASDRKALLPGLPPQGEHPPQIVIDSILPDEALKALFEIDFSQLESTSFEWNRRRREWVPKERW